MHKLTPFVQGVIRSVLAMLIFADEDPLELTRADGLEQYVLSNVTNELPRLLREVGQEMLFYDLARQEVFVSDDTHLRRHDPGMPVADAEDIQVQPLVQGHQDGQRLLLLLQRPPPI